METRPLGRTGHNSTVVIFGSAALWHADQATANNALDMAEAAGVNHIDVAPQYGNAEDVVGPWLTSRREKFFLGCKTLMRDKDAAWKQLHESLEKLQTDHFDLYQLHAITTQDELDAAMGPGGAIEALQRAKDEGIVKNLGITGHFKEVPKLHYEALQRFDFDTVMFPINPVLYAVPEYRADAEKLLALCQERNVGVQVIKAIAKQPWADRSKAPYITWYEPYDIQEKVDMSVNFALSQPGVTGIPSAGDTKLLPMVLDAASRFKPLSSEEQAALIAQSKELEPLFQPG